MPNQVFQLNKNFPLQSHGLFTDAAEGAQVFTGSSDYGVFVDRKRRKQSILVLLLPSQLGLIMERVRICSVVCKTDPLRFI